MHEHRLVNVTLTVKQAEEAIEYWLRNAVLKESQAITEVTFNRRDEQFTVVFQQQDEVAP